MINNMLYLVTGRQGGILYEGPAGGTQARLLMELVRLQSRNKCRKSPTMKVCCLWVCP